MVENFVNLFTELSKETIKQELGLDDDEFERKRRNGKFNKFIRILRRKCFDILLGSHPDMDYVDPCKTPYGADWHPAILLLDYGGELARFGAEKSSKRLSANIEKLQTKNYKSLHDMYKLIFLLRGPCIKSSDELQPTFLNTVIEYSLTSNRNESEMYNAMLLSTENNTLPSELTNKKYSSNLFECGCQLMRKLSNKSVTSERMRSEHLMSVSSSKIHNHSRSLPVSSDIVIKRKCHSSSSFVQVASNLYSSNNLLWNNFVEKPIYSKLRNALHPLENTSYHGSGESGQCVTKTFELCEAQNNKNITKQHAYWTEISDVGESLKLIDVTHFNCKQNENANGKHLYPILKENSLKLKNYESCFGSKSKRRQYGLGAKNSFFESSATLILALWEQDHKYRYMYDTELIGALAELRVLEVAEFLKDVQFLLVGIGTDTFKFEENEMSFTMKEGTCLEGVTPNTLLSFSKEYLEIGACYVKLSHYTNLYLKRQLISDLKDCRIIFKVFWMSVYDYLCRHSQYVLKIPLNFGLLEFKACVKNLHPIITTVAEICKVSDSQGTFPQGGQLLSYLLQVTQKITNKYVAEVFYGFLKACCETYLLQLLQEWLFQGQLDRNHRDFFVEHRPKKPKYKDRSYYLSFYMFCDRVPTFLKGIEQSIFNCGKTIHLLKLIQPESKLCRILETRAYPKMNLCLSKNELSKHLKTFEEYSRNVSKICGQFATIASLKQEELSRLYDYEKYIMDVKKEQEIERDLIKKESLAELRRKREKQNEWLKKQVELAEEEKKKKKEEEEMETRLFISKIQEITEKEKRIVEEEKLNMKLYYEELMEQVNKRKTDSLSWKQRSAQLNRTNALLKNYQSIGDLSYTERSNKSDTKDNEFSLLDGNVIMDREGNIVSVDDFFSKPELDLVNLNVPESTIETQADDIKNENITVNEPDKQLLNVIASRIEYEEKKSSQCELLLSSNNRVELSIVELNTLTDNHFQSRENNEDMRAIKVNQSSKSSSERNKVKESSELEQENKKNKMQTAIRTVEAQENKKKVMGCGLNFKSEGGEEVERSSEEFARPETEALKNKKKMLESEYGMTLNNESEEKKITGSNPEFETEAQKNKKKVMASEFAFGVESVGDKKSASNSTIPTVETEAQRNKKKVMGCEYGEELPSESCLPLRRVNSKEAERNKRKVLETEFGYSKLPSTTIRESDDIKSVENVDTQACAADCDDFTVNVIEDENWEYDNISNNSARFTTLSEKALQIFNKQRGRSDPKFFTLKENNNNENLTDNFSWLDFSGVQVLFEQNLRRPVDSNDPTGSDDRFIDMDITTFMNYVRKSVLIPLQVQEEIANEALFNHLLKEENMLSHFNALRNYFFLNDGEFSRRLTQNIFMTLARCSEPQQFFKRSTMNQIVYEALTYSIHSNEPQIQNVSFEIIDMPPYLSHSSHDVLAPFDLSYQVKWPLNIIVTEKALSKYKLVFHFLLKLKRINWTLNENFSYLTYTSRDKSINSRILLNSSHYHKIHIYRHAMSQFMRTLENYTSSCSLQFSWLNFQKDLESAKNLDHLYDKHVRYIKEVLKRCFLTKESQELLSCINSMIELSLKFHYATKSGKWIPSGSTYLHTKFDVLKVTFTDFCNLTTEFLKTLRKKINHHHDLKQHEVLMEKFDMILR